MADDIVYNLQYIEWIKKSVGHGVYDPWQYNKLFLYLFNAEFTWSIPMDENRAIDGTKLRYRFGYEMIIPNAVIEKQLDIFPCSVLEMLAALAIRCAETITQDLDGFDKPSDIFWIMMENLRLVRFTDDHFSEKRVSAIIRRLLNREFSPTGEGGLFIVPQPRRDLRCVDFWYHMQWYLATVRDWYGNVWKYGLQE